MSWPSTVHDVPLDTFFSLDKFLHYQRNFEYVSFVTPLSDWRVPVVISTTYLVAIFVLRKVMNLMSNPLPVKWLSAFHNFNMLVISFACFFGQAYGLYDILSVSSLLTCISSTFCLTLLRV